MAPTAHPLEVFADKTSRVALARAPAPKSQPAVSGQEWAEENCVEVFADKASRMPLARAPAPKSQPAVVSEREWAAEEDFAEVRGLGQQWPEENPVAEDSQPTPSTPQLVRYAPKPLPVRAERGASSSPLRVVLDLDHTLVYSQDHVGEGYDFYFTKGKQAAYVWKRPGLDKLLSWLRHAHVEAVVYTAASSSYAEGVARHLDPDGTLFRRRFSRGDCPLTPPAKDLMRLGSDLRRTVLVDDSLSALRLQPDNGIPVSAYTGGADEEMLRVHALLEELLPVEDVRKVLRGRFRVAERLRKRATRTAAGALAISAAALAAGREAAAAAGQAAQARPPAEARPAAAAAQAPAHGIKEARSSNPRQLQPRP